MHKSLSESCQRPASFSAFGYSSKHRLNPVQSTGQHLLPLRDTLREDHKVPGCGPIRRSPVQLGSVGKLDLAAREHIGLLGNADNHVR